MIPAIISYYNLLLQQTGIYEVNFDFAEKITDGGKDWYAVYSGDASYSFSNQDFSDYQGASYWFLRSDVLNKPIPDPNISGRFISELSIPLSLVSIIPRDLFEQDCSTTGLSVIETIDKATGGPTKDLKKLITARSVILGDRVRVTDRNKIIAAQYKNCGPIDVDYEYHYFQLDITINVTITNACLTSICNVESQDVINLFNWCNPSTYNRITAENRQCIQDNVCSGGGGSVNINKSDGTLIVNVLGAEPAANSNVSDSVISSTGGGFVVNVKATDPETLSDVPYTDSDGVNKTQEYNPAIPIVCTPTVTPLGISYRQPQFTGAVTSYAANDAEDQATQGAYTYVPPPYPISYARRDMSVAKALRFFTLVDNNEYGNTDVFTDDLGAQVYASGVFKDHVNRRMYGIVPITSTSWFTALTDTASLVLGGYSGWRMCVMNEYHDLVNTSLGTSVWDYAPLLNTDPAQIYATIDTIESDTIYAYGVYPNIKSLTGNGLIYNVNRLLKMNPVKYLVVQNF